MCEIKPLGRDRHAKMNFRRLNYGACTKGKRICFSCLSMTRFLGKTFYCLHESFLTVMLTQQKNTDENRNKQCCTAHILICCQGNIEQYY